MNDKIGLGKVVTDRLKWGMRERPRSAERKAFDEAVKKWEKLRRLEEQGPGPEKRTARAPCVLPLSRVIRVFAAWK